MSNEHNYSGIAADVVNIDLEQGLELPLQGPAAPRVQNAAEDLINTKKTNLRGYFDSVYSCESAHKDTRISDVVFLLRDIDSTIDPETAQNPPADPSALYIYFVVAILQEWLPAHQQKH